LCDIWVRPDRARADMAATLAHELAHAVTHEACAGMTRDVREVIAESVAYAVCSRFGLDLSLRSVDYVASWLDDPEAFRVGMAAIHDGAASLIDAIEAAIIEEGGLELAA
jgi:antirestriction protein ArdC